MIRALHTDDIDQLREIHAKYFYNEFEFPDFLNNFLCAFVVVNSEGSIISGGGVRAIAESIVITNKDFPVEERRTALYQILDVSEWLTRKADFNQLHAFVQDEQWQRHLEKVGFHPTKGRALVLELKNGER